MQAIQEYLLVTSVNNVILKVKETKIKMPEGQHYHDRPADVPGDTAGLSDDALMGGATDAAHSMLYSSEIPSQGNNPMGFEEQLKLLNQGEYVQQKKNEWKRNLEFETQLHIAQSHDNLTGLLNLQGITSKIEYMMEELNEREFGVLYIDLNGFKKINDSLGHGTGDELLTIFGTKLDHILRHANGEPGDEIIEVQRPAPEERNEDGSKDAIIDTDAARAGGDEFIVIVNLKPRKPEEGEESESMSPRQRLQVVENRIREAATEIAASDERFANFGAAIGGAVWTGGSSEEILREAEHQMSADKPEGSR